MYNAVAIIREARADGGEGDKAAAPVEVPESGSDQKATLAMHRFTPHRAGAAAEPNGPDSDDSATLFQHRFTPVRAGARAEEAQKRAACEGRVERRGAAPRAKALSRARDAGALAKMNAKRTEGAEDQRAVVALIPAANESSRPSLWARFITSVTRLMPRSPEAIPAPAVAPTKIVEEAARERTMPVDEVLALLWQLPPHHVRAVARFGTYVLAMRENGPEAFIEAQLVDLLARMRAGDRAVPLAVIREKFRSISSAMLDDALLRLEGQGKVTLLAAPREFREEGRLAAINHPTRGLLDRCVYWKGARIAARAEA